MAVFGFIKCQRLDQEKNICQPFFYFFTTKLYYFIDAKQLSRLLFSDFPMHRQTPLYRIRALHQDP